MKTKLTPDEYLAEMNTQLKQHLDYADGMAFVAYPEGSTGAGMSGYCTTGPFQLTWIYSQVAHHVSNNLRFELGMKLADW